MELYLEKEFIDHFYLEYDDSSLSVGKEAVVSVLRDYAEITWYMNVEAKTIEDFEKLKSENPFISFRTSQFPFIPISSVKDSILKKGYCNQVLIFTENEEEWFEEAEKRGAICFSIETYEARIHKIIKTCHFKLDLSQVFQGWHLLKSIAQLPVNKMIINDGYVLTDKYNQKMEKNIIPLIKTLIIHKKIKTEIQFFTKDLNIQLKEETKNKESVHKATMEAKRMRMNKLNSVFEGYETKFKVVLTNDARKILKFDFHDRLIYLNYVLVDCPKGFNLIPHINSNSQLIVASIFEKYTYNRIRNHVKTHEKFLEEIGE